MLFGTTNRWEKQVYPLLSLSLTPLSGGGLTHCCARYLSSFPSHLQLPNYLTYSAGHFEKMRKKNLGSFMPLIRVLWYLDRYLVDCGYIDAVVVVDETPAMAAKVAMSDGKTKTAFLAVSAIKPLEVLCSMPSSCGTCWKTIRWSRE